MATVEKDIREESAKIKAVRRIVRKRADNLDDREILPTPISDGPNWKDLVFSHPERCVRIGTLFSGIGAIEHAFQRLGLNHKIVFAGDIEPKCKLVISRTIKSMRKIGLLIFVSLMQLNIKEK